MADCIADLRGDHVAVADVANVNDILLQLEAAGIPRLEAGAEVLKALSADTARIFVLNPGRWPKEVGPNDPAPARRDIKLFSPGLDWEGERAARPRPAPLPAGREGVLQWLRCCGSDSRCIGILRSDAQRLFGVCGPAEEKQAATQPVEWTVERKIARRDELKASGQRKYMEILEAECGQNRRQINREIAKAGLSAKSSKAQAASPWAGLGVKVHRMR